MLPQTGQSSLSRCALTLLAPAASRKKEVCVQGNGTLQDVVFKLYSIQTLAVPPSLKCLRRSLLRCPQGSAPHGCASHQAIAQLPLPAKGGTASRLDKTPQLSVFFLGLPGRSYKPGHILQNTMTFNNITAQCPAPPSVVATLCVQIQRYVIPQ